ncbi:MAG: aromatic ring-hydroxylating dioxygenase subunit alpha [Pseudomonadota bacterium]|nr:aromatic ring-hydroxylating dioxygenase subunit alpha [Pseudomonadota bacterium]
MKAVEKIMQERPDGFTDRKIYTDPEIFEQEKQRIFAKVWVLIGHQTEVPNPGDYVTKTIIGQPLILMRGDDNEVRVLFNTCRHRASLVAIEAEGNCKGNTLKCPYHGFEYNAQGDLVKVPQQEAYGAWFKKEEFGLVSMPRVANYNGMIFGSLNPDVMPIEEYLGPAADFIPYATAADGEELVMVDTYKYDIAANWKLLIDNTMDGYHVPYVHGAMFEAFGLPKDARMEGCARTLGHHGSIDWEESRPLAARTTNRYMAIFPNITVHYNASGDMFAIRQIEPLNVDRMQVTMWLLAPKSTATREMNEKRAKAFTITWGPGGLFGSDDARQLEWVQMGMKADCGAPVLAARGLENGLEDDWENEQSMRGFRDGWNHYMGQG